MEHLKKVLADYRIYIIKYNDENKIENIVS